MSNGTYSAVDFQAWFDNDAHVEKFADVQELITGVDVAKQAFYAALTSQHTEDSDVVYFERHQISEFVDRLARLEIDAVTLVAEPTGTYSDALVEQARDAGLDVIRINGDRVANARKIFDGTDSLHDGKAAHLLAHLYQCGVGRAWEQREESVRQMRSLADLDEIVEQTEQRYVGQLEAVLARHWPELTDLLELQSATLLELVDEYPDPARVAEHPRKARELMKKVGGPLLSDTKIERVLESARTTCGRPMGPGDRQKLKYIAGMLRDSQQRSAKLNRQIEEVAESHEDTQQLAGYTGARTAVVLVGFLGALTDYDSPQQLEKAMGLNLCERSSGVTAEDKRTESYGLHISKRGPGRVRKMLYWLALRMINPRQSVYCPYATAWYQERLRRNGGHKLKAIVALMRKATRALWWLARGKDYDGTKLFDVHRLKKLGHL